MGNVKRLLDNYMRLNPSNKFAVLVYARMKLALQDAALVRPYTQERRRPCRVAFPSAHWVQR